MTLTFTPEEAQRLASLLRISADDDARETHNVTVQRAEQEALDMVRSKMPEQICESGGFHD
ncbi:hypothetical protein [Rhodococcus sp. NPDC004095]